MKLSEIDYSNNFNDLDIDLKNYINTDNHVVFLDSNLSSILNLDENLNIFEKIPIGKFPIGISLSLSLSFENLKT